MWKELPVPLPSCKQKTEYFLYSRLEPATHFTARAELSGVRNQSRESWMRGAHGAGAVFIYSAEGALRGLCQPCPARPAQTMGPFPPSAGPAPRPWRQTPAAAPHGPPVTWRPPRGVGCPQQRWRRPRSGHVVAPREPRGPSWRRRSGAAARTNPGGGRGGGTAAAATTAGEGGTAEAGTTARHGERGGRGGAAPPARPAPPALPLRKSGPRPPLPSIPSGTPRPEGAPPLPWCPPFPTRRHRNRGQLARPYLVCEAGAGSTQGGAATAEDCIEAAGERGGGGRVQPPAPPAAYIPPRTRPGPPGGARAPRGDYRSRHATRPPRRGKPGAPPRGARWEV